MRAKDPITHLTAQQELFARAVALQGLNYSDAYRSAYNVSPDSTLATVNASASVVANIHEVSTRITSLRATVEAEAVVSATSLVTELMTVGGVKVPPSRVRAADKVAAIDKVAKILGLYRDQEPEGNRAVAITQVTVVLHRDDGSTMREVDMPAEKQLAPAESEPLVATTAYIEE